MDRIGLAWCLLVIGVFQQTFAASLNDACVNPRKQAGVCIGLRQCKELSDIWTKPIVSPEESAYVQQSQCGKDANRKVLVCCAGASRPAEPSEPTNVLPRPFDCGRDLSDRIFGGQPTAVDEFPWTALLHYRKPQNRYGHHCGGTLINNRYVLTAAHCIKAVPATWKVIGVRLGEYNLTNDAQDCYKDVCSDPPVDFGVDKIIIHEQYDPKSAAQWNDIALIRLDRNVETSDFISPICLPLEDRIKSLNQVGTKQWAAGWGRTENNEPSDVKLKVQLEVSDWDRCSNLYKRARAVLRKTQLCAGGKKDEDTCSGDSGGPLMRQIGATYYQFGIVSFGPKKCGTPDAPGVYTDVSQFVDWIESKLE
ncbi:CLIP domain-containing serine protease B4-like [Uranotaenia lowii]|uniref:CLIP domain-containing serine protease B4-like n=1 Tax=Uranotaenia lowii TaxID=190385 RepID=UPI0024795D21|nr:CLIP domain-containing serine protease B4-like [Uranotaenia lowii]